MSHLLKITSALLLCIGLLQAATLKEVSPKELKSIQELELFKQADIKVQQAFDAQSLYILNILVQDRQQELLLTKDKKVIISGKAIDIKTGQQIIIPVDMTILKGKEAITYGTGPKEYYVFTDPECPYCKRFESYFEKIKDKVKFHIFFYPLSFHKNAREMSLYILSKKTNEERIKAMFSVTPTLKAYKNRKIEGKERLQLEAQLDENMSIAQNLNVSGTPSVFDPEGRKISWAQLLIMNGIDLK